MFNESMFVEFEQDLRAALLHLYDPIYSPSPLLCRVLGCPPEPGPTAMQEAMIQAITLLKPAEDVPPNSRVRRMYNLLSCRYVQEQTQEETADRLGISPRHLRREQQQAVHILAQRLWKHYEDGGRTQPGFENQGGIQAASPQEMDSGTEWRTQVRQELASLEQSDPGAVADVQEEVQAVFELGRKMASRLSVEMTLHLDGKRLAANIHRSLLRQILIVAIQKQLHQMSGGQIEVTVGLEGEQVVIAITGGPLKGMASPDSEFIRETVALQGGAFDAHRQDDRFTFHVSLPHAKESTILVIDDNADLVHFFQRFTVRTSYQLVHVDQGRAAFAAIKEVKPDVVVLDVMLPDMDGWEILTRLHEDPATREIPVIVCSVIRQKDLALALGAKGYVTKPVRRAEFLHALEQALAQDAEVGRPDSG